MKCIGAERNLYFRNEPNRVESDIAQPPWKLSHDKAVAQPITRQSSKSLAELTIRAFNRDGAPVKFADGHQTFRGEHAMYFRAILSGNNASNAAHIDSQGGRFAGPNKGVGRSECFN